MLELLSMTRRLSIALIVAAMAIALPVSAYRVEFIANVDGKRVAGAQVCFYPASSAQEAFARFLSSNDVRCVAADNVIEIPPGHWNYFVRAGGYISSHPENTNTCNYIQRSTLPPPVTNN